MDNTNIISFISSIALIAIGFYLKYAKENEINYPKSNLKSIQKFWFVFIIIGLVYLSFDIYKVVAK